MPRQSDARERMITSAALLFREQGVQGTSFADVLAHSGAPRGSVYHHFGGGKSQLAVETTQWAGEFMAAAIASALEEHDPVEGIRVFVARWIKLVRQSDFEAGCTIVAAALEGAREPAAREAAGRAFAGWERTIARALRRAGVRTARANALATLVIASVEGGVILARAQRSVAPLQRVGRELETVLVAALQDAATTA